MKFIVDNNAGKLVGWLRALGYDTLFINPIEDGELVRIAQRDRRVILSRDRGLLLRRPIARGSLRAVHVRGDDWRVQLAQVVRELDLGTEPQDTRCMACNGILVPRSPAEARGHVPQYVAQTQSSFLSCPDCGRYYWQGTHWGKITRILSGVLEPDETAPG